MQNVDAAFSEVAPGLVEEHAHQRRETREARFVVRLDGDEDVLVIEPGVLVSPPGVDRERVAAMAREVELFANREIGVAGMGPELDRHSREAGLDQPMDERDVALPGMRRDEPAWFTVDLVADAQSRQQVFA